MKSTLFATILLYIDLILFLFYTPVNNNSNTDSIHLSIFYLFFKLHCIKLILQIIFNCIVSCRGVPRIWEGGGQEFFFRFGNLHVAKRHACALLGGFGGMVPRENFLKRCNLVRFRVYFDQILSLFFSKKCHFLYKK